MAGWNTDELRRVGDAEELQIAPVRRNDEEHRATTLRLVPR